MAFQVLVDAVATPEQAGLAAFQVFQAPVDLAAFLAQVDSAESLACLGRAVATADFLGTLVTPAQADLAAHLAIAVIQVPVVLLENLGTLDLVDFQAHLERLELQAHPVVVATVELQAHLAVVATVELQACQALAALVAHLAVAATAAILAHRA